MIALEYEFHLYYALAPSSAGGGGAPRALRKLMHGKLECFALRCRKHLAWSLRWIASIFSSFGGGGGVGLIWQRLRKFHSQVSGSRKLEVGLYASSSSHSFLILMMTVRASRPMLMTLQRSLLE